MLDADGTKVILICYRWQTFDPEMIHCVGVDPTAEKVLAMKITLRDHDRPMFRLDPEAIRP